MIYLFFICFAESACDVEFLSARTILVSVAFRKLDAEAKIYSLTMEQDNQANNLSDSNNLTKLFVLLSCICYTLDMNQIIFKVDWTMSSV